MGNAQAASELKLSPQDVAEKVLSSAYKTQEINLNSQLGELATATARAPLDWQLEVASGIESDKLRSFQYYNKDLKSDYYKTDLALKKPFSTGTTITAMYSRYELKSELSPFITPQRPERQYLDQYGLEFEQNLLYDMFGTATRATIKAADENYEATKIIRADSLEDLVLESIQLYWQTYVAQINFREALAARDRYKQIIDVVKRKSRLGFANPGEYPLVQAEFESRERLVKSTSNEYLESLEKLQTLLKLPKEQDILFDAPQNLPPVPKLKPVNVDNLRSVRSSKSKIAAVKNELHAAKWESYPVLAFEAKYYASGVAELAQDSYSDMLANKYPNYYVGLKLQTTFGSDSQSETIRNRTIAKTLEETTLNRKLAEIDEGLNSIEREVQANYAIAKSTEAEKNFREKAVQDLTKAYSQGRTDINVLVDNLNRFFDSQVLYAKSLGNYHIALNKWAATRDELLPDDQPSEKERK